MEKNRKGIILGIILIFIGTFFMLKNFNYDISEWILPSIGVIFIVGYFIKKRTSLLVLGLILFYIGMTDKEYFNSIILIVIGALILVHYILKRKLVALIFSLLIMSIGTFVFVFKITGIDLEKMWPLLFMNFAISFLVVFILEFKKLGFRPLFVSIIFLIIGFLSFMTINDMIDNTFWNKTLDIAQDYWPVLIIIVGVFIMFNRKPILKKD